MQKGLIISNISNLYYVELNGKVYECTARGKMKQDDKEPVVGDIVNIEILNEENMVISKNLELFLNNNIEISNKKAVISEILERNTYMKRPKIANLSQIIFVVSLKMPMPDLLLLDKQLIYAEFMGVKPIICINKIDLDTKSNLEKIKKLYTNIGYKVITTNAKEKIRNNRVKKSIKG